MTLKDVDERLYRDTQLAASLLCTMTLMWDRHGAAACSLMPRGSFREILVYTIKDRGTEALHIYDGIGIALHMYVPCGTFIYTAYDIPTSSYAGCHRFVMLRKPKEE